MGSHIQVMCINAAPLSHSLLQLPTNIRDWWHDLPASIFNSIPRFQPEQKTPDCISTMLTSLQATLGDQSYSNGRSSTSSSSADIATVYTSPAKVRTKVPNTNDIEVRVGKPPYARFIHIPGSALKACPVLRARLVQGCRIINSDVDVFEIILDYLGSSSLLRRLRPSAKKPLKQLTGGCDTMLKLAKAWHLADMLDDVRLQNKLVDTYRAFYLELLNAHAQTPLEHEPFIYLEDHIGTHTKIEKFIIDFFAGLTRHTGDFSAEELLPFRHDVAQSLKLRRAQLVVLRLSNDMIATGNGCFNVSKLDTTKHASLHVTMPIKVSSSTDLSSSSSKRSCSTSMSSSSVSPHITPRAPMSVSSLICGRGHRMRLPLPETTSSTGQSEVMVSHTLRSALKPNFGAALQPSHTRSVSLMTSPPSGAPFVRHRPVARRRETVFESDEDSSDEDTVYDLFPPRLPTLPRSINELFGTSVTTDV